jgi:hypothetical protein
MNRSVLPRGLTTLVVAALAWFLAPVASAQTVLVLPYVQPGDGRTLTGTDVKVITWLTDQKPGEFVVEFTAPGGPTRTVRPTRIALDFAALKATKKAKEPARDKDAGEKKADGGEKDPKKDRAPLPPEKEQHYFRYTAHLDGLPFNADVRYCVKLGDRVIREASFRTRATPDREVRCVLVGDLAQGRDAQRQVAYQISLQKPEFLVALGDIVYPTGRVNQYMAYYWTTYNDVPAAGPKTGAPLMATVPFYPVLGNHDIGAKLPKVPDALAVYYFFAPPRNGPGEGPWATPLGDDETAAQKFRKAAADSYPNLDAYSFDYGAAHFVVLNNNKGVTTEDPAFHKWLREDLKATKATWKIVCFHVPGFQSAKQHYPEQQTRLLQPIFEECGVDVTFAGHVHNYQRSVPLKFTPTSGRDKKGRVNGTFTLDTAFDGVKVTQPRGVIHMVAGGGGASLYGPGLDKTAAQLQKEHGANYAPFTAKMVADQHSFVVLDIAPARLELRALSVTGEEIDHVLITKGK